MATIVTLRKQNSTKVMDNDNKAKSKNKTVKQWKCDVCQKFSFPTFEEAVAHEEECRRVVAIEAEKKEESSSQLHPFFQKTQCNSKRKKEATEVSLAMAPEQEPTKKRKKAVVPDKAPSKQLQIFEFSTFSQTDKETSSDEEKPGSCADRSSIRGEKGKTKVMKETKSSKESTNTEISALAAIMGVDVGKLLAEQKSAELQLKRRQQSEQFKKPSPVSSQSNLSAPSLASVSARTQKASKNRRHEAILFPRHNHLIPRSRELESMGNLTPISVGEDWLTEDKMVIMRERYREAGRMQINRTEYSKPIPRDKYEPLIPDPTSRWKNPSTATTITRDRILHDLLRSCLKVLPANTSSSSSQLWVDQFRFQSLPDDLCGSSLRAAHAVLQSFVQEWRVVRQRCLAHMADKHMRRSRKPVNNKRRKYKDDDDELWSDSDDSEDDLGLPSLCLVTGPVGCGKTDLIRAVVAQAECRLIEMSTADKRGAAALKKAIGEATQSLSSSELMSKKTKTNAFFTIKEEALVDSDDDDEKKESNGSTLTAILVDEVDNLYEQNGDNGFWSALVELSRKAKCPIFLTANSLAEPKFHCKRVSIELPDPSECVSRIRHLIESSGRFVFEGDDALIEEIACLCHCDMRKIAHELQSFAYGSSSEKSSKITMCPEITMSSEITMSPEIMMSSKITMSPEITSAPAPVEQHPSSSPVISSMVHVQSVTPASAYADQYSLLEIRGVNFSRLMGDDAAANGEPVTNPVEVYVGEDKCPVARILDDNTIVAVCQPRKAERCADVIYPLIRVCGTEPLGMLSDTQRSISIDFLADGRSVVTLPTPIYLTCHFQQAPQKTDEIGKQQGDASVEECEFDDGDSMDLSSQSQAMPSGTTAIDWATTTTLLKEGIRAWRTRHPELVEKRNDVRSDDSDCCSLQQLEEMCAYSQLSSDAALLEDLGMIGLPFLAGPAWGYGFDLTDAYPRCTNENSRRPSEETLMIDYGWKDNCAFFGECNAYTTANLTRRERFLLARCERSARGLSLPEGRAEEKNLETNDEDYFPCRHATEEDGLLPNMAPTCLISLPHYFRKSNDNYSIAPTCDPEETYESLAVAYRTERKQKRILEVLDKYLFVLDNWKCRLFFAGVHRPMDPLLSKSETMDRRLWLDYLPLIRCMAALDHAAEAAFNQALSEQGAAKAASLSNQKRQTRRTTRRGFSHYVETLVPSCVWQEQQQVQTAEPMTPSAMMELLAEK